MAKSKSPGAPSWMVTFADMMALLLCLFVLLLSFAEMDVTKYKQVAGSMRDAFGAYRMTMLAGVIETDGTPMRTSPTQIVSVPIPEPPQKKEDKKEDETKKADPTTAPPAGLTSAPPTDPAPVESQAFKNLKNVMAGEISKGEMQVVESEGKIIIRFPEKTAFPAGTDTLTDKFIPTIDKLAGPLAGSNGKIVISGHSDNIPISTDRFRSNWDLSSARAVSVVHHLLATTNINPGRIVAQGFADSRPLAPNDSVESRAQNRRVEIQIESE